MLLPGTYSLTCSAPGYVTRTVTGVTVGAGDATRVDVALVPNGFVAPAPDIQINGQNGPLSVPATTPLSFTVSIAPNHLAGVPHDWWLSVTNTAFTAWWNAPALWYFTPMPCYDGPLIPLGNFQFAFGTLPPGTWTFTFGVDARDGTYQGTFADSITITTN
jgi:hypothetical protein